MLVSDVSYSFDFRTSFVFFDELFHESLFESFQQAKTASNSKKKGNILIESVPSIYPSHTHSIYTNLSKL